jgi:hypothetical protein
MSLPTTLLVNVKNWLTGSNAIGDGIADDTPAINAAAAYLSKYGGGVLYFPAGIYRVRQTRLDLNDQRVPWGTWFMNDAVEIEGSNIILEGEGSASIIQIDPQTPWTTAIAFVFTAPPLDNGNPVAERGNVVVRNLTFRASISSTLLQSEVGTNPPIGINTGAAGAALTFVGRAELYAKNIY